MGSMFFTIPSLAVLMLTQKVLKKVAVVNLVKSSLTKGGGQMASQSLGTNLEKKRIKDNLVLHAEKVHLQHKEHLKQQVEGKSSQPCSHWIQAWKQSYQSKNSER